MGCLLCLYLPASWLFSRVADPRVIEIMADPFAPGDVVLVNHCSFLFSTPRAGDVVLYCFPGLRIGNYQYQSGDMIDRILAEPGDHVNWTDGKLFVNDRESPWLPLNQSVAVSRPATTLSQGLYLILPSALRYPTLAAQQTALNAVNLVPGADIVGGVYWRHQPLARWWLIR